jgi:hypothetical protein
MSYDPFSNGMLRKNLLGQHPGQHYAKLGSRGAIMSLAGVITRRLRPNASSRVLNEPVRQRMRDRTSSPSCDPPSPILLLNRVRVFQHVRVIAKRGFFNMATTLSQSTLHSSDNRFPSRIFIGVVGGITFGGILAVGGHYIGERDCQPRVEWCNQADKLWLPDEPAQKDSSNPLGTRRTITIATSTSTLTPTNAIVPATSK